MAIPKEPRALMIQLMYLVLTAMLALNITREVLNAFQTINSSIVTSNQTISEKNQSLYETFDQMEAKKEDAERVKPLNDKAKLVKGYSEEITAYLETLKDTVVNRADGYTLNEKTGLMEPKRMEDIDAGFNYFYVEKNGNTLREKLKTYVDNILAVIDDPEAKENFRKQIPLALEDFKPSEDNPSGDWVYGTFHNIPVVAVSTMLSKFQSDVKNGEALIIEHLIKQIHVDQIHFDGLTPIAVPNTSYAMAGDDIEATITLAAYNKNVNPTITSNSGAVQVKDGVGTLKFKASGAGLKTVSGTVSLPVKGKMESFPYKFDYYVGTTGGSLQLDKMNVMYIGVPNPVTASAAGYDINTTNLIFSSASKIEKGEKAGQYNVWVDKPSGKEGVPYKITAKNKAGGTDEVATGTVRIKTIPDPVAELNGVNSGYLATNIAKAQLGPVAKLHNFDFDVRFEILEYEFVYAPQGDMAQPAMNKGARFTNDVKALMNRSKAGDKWFISNIKAKGPDGKVRTIPGINITLN